MGLILQCQRRAIEKLLTQKKRIARPLIKDSLALPMISGNDGRRLHV